MCNRNENLSYKYFKKTSDNSRLHGLGILKNALEKVFYADVSIGYKTKGLESYILVNLNCNFKLTDALYQLNSGNWGCFQNKYLNFGLSQFEIELIKLQRKNTQKIVINEVVFQFSDTSLFINKIPNKSIPSHLYNIFNVLAKNFVHITKGLCEKPYEIFIPVFEESYQNNLQNKPSENNFICNSYFDYWGLYYESEKNKDFMVLDIINKTIIKSDYAIIYKD